MNKKELKSAFEKEFKNINVSNELKEKTLNAINTSSKQKTSHIPYIRNFAAVFVVTLLCLSIYFSNNSYKNQPNTYDTLKENSIYETEATENSLEKAYGAPLQKSLNRENIKNSAVYDTYSLDNSFAPSKLQSTANTESLKEESTIFETKDFSSIKAISEEDFLAQYPNAKKIENGYVIYENEKETIYIFKNKILENIIIID